MAKQEKSTPENGPRLETDLGNGRKQTEILVERGPNHPAGPGTTVITTYEDKR